MPPLQIAVVRAPDQIVVRLTGDVDGPAAGRLVRALQEAAVVGRGAVVVDVAGARFRDSSGLQALAIVSDALVSAGRGCRVVGAPAATRNLVRTSGLGDRLELDGLVDQVDPHPAVPPSPPRAASSARRASPPRHTRRTADRSLSGPARPAAPRGGHRSR